MVPGLVSFQEWFLDFEEQYVIIGGTACELLMNDVGLEFRATKDIDLVLIVEAITKQFGERLWEYVKQAGYEHINKSTNQPQFYRFSKPKSNAYPYMIELFAKNTNVVSIANDAVLAPIHFDDSLSSLSAILLNEEYYELLHRGKVLINGLSVLDVGSLIIFKAKAWLDLSNRKAKGENIDSKDIRKHRNDIFKLSNLLTPSTRVVVSSQIKKEFEYFLESMQTEDVQLKQLGIKRDKSTVLKTLSDLCCIY